MWVRARPVSSSAFMPSVFARMQVEVGLACRRGLSCRTRKTDRTGRGRQAPRSAGSDGRTRSQDALRAHRRAGRRAADSRPSRPPRTSPNAPSARERRRDRAAARRAGARTIRALEPLHDELRHVVADVVRAPRAVYILASGLLLTLLAAGSSPCCWSRIDRALITLMDNAQSIGHGQLRRAGDRRAACPRSPRSSVRSSRCARHWPARRSRAITSTTC